MITLLHFFMWKGGGIFGYPRDKYQLILTYGSFLKLQKFSFIKLVINCLKVTT